MHFLGELGSPGFFLFSVDGVTTQTLCDQFNPGVTTEPYFAMLANLSDLTGTVLQNQGDPLALQKYTWIGILASRAYSDPSLAGDVTRALRYIVDGQGALTSGAQDLLDWVATQDPAAYTQTLANFVIYAPITAPGFILPTQEQVGYTGGTGGTGGEIPEPSTMLLIGAGLVVLPFTRRMKIRAPQQ